MHSKRFLFSDEAIHVDDASNLILFSRSPFLIVGYVREEWEEDPRGNEQTEKILESDAYQYIQYILLGVGVLLAALFILQIIFFAVRWTFARCLKQVEILKEFISTSSARGDARLKRAATRKVNNLLMNADRLHQPNEILSGLSPSDSTMIVSSDQTMRNYVLDEDRTEKVGGLIWTWWRILDGRLFDTEGIWINTRLIIIQASQLVLLVSVTLLMFLSIPAIAKRAEDARDDLGSAPQWVYDLVPTERAYARVLHRNLLLILMCVC